MSAIVDTAANLTLDKLFSIEDEYRYIVPTATPLCIIKYGPPGSGKSSADEYIKNMFHINLTNFTKIDKDIPLISIRAFRTGSLDIRQRYEGIQVASQKIQTLQDEILNEKNSEGLSINDKMPIALQRAFDYNLNVLWETTCQSARSQQLMETVFRAIPSVYRIVVLFPIVSFATSKKRVISRALSHLRENPPYFRPVPLDRLTVARAESIRYFTEHIMPRVLDGKIYQLFCYNNEGRPSSANYNKITNKNVNADKKRSTVKRVAPGWRFGLDSKSKRITVRKL